MKQSLYLETSVVGAYLDNGEPFRRDLTIRWWEHELSEYQPFVSMLVRRELERVPEPHRTGYLKLIEPLKHLEASGRSGDSGGRLHLARHLSSQIPGGRAARRAGFVSQNRLSGDVEFRASGKRPQTGAHPRFQRRGGLFRADDRDAGISDSQYLENAECEIKLFL